MRLRRRPNPDPSVTWAALVGDELTTVLCRHGAEAGHFAVLGPDPWRVIWNDDRSGFVAFLEARHCLVSWRSPVATQPEQAELLARLQRHARALNKQLFAVPVNKATADAAVALGMHATWIGTECLIDLRHWTLQGGRRQKVRWARSHAIKLGYAWREAHPLVSRTDFDGLQRIEERWKQERRERRTDSFLRNEFTELAHLRRYFVCEGPNGVVASITCTPVNHSTWYLQDPVRDPNAPRGALEGAMVLALDTFRDEGFTWASNGPLPFWRPDGVEDRPHPLGLLGDRVLNYFDRRYRFARINQFRSKFLPDQTWPVFVVRSHRFVTPRAIGSLVRVLTRAID